MAIEVYPRPVQANGKFNDGEILEKKPIGFPQDGGKLKPYSSLFYWAHAWAESDSLIKEHPHKGFEILSFVLSGEIEHFDSKLNRWKRLMAGDVQIIRSGSGISHAEKMYKGASMFQIWFDPNLSKSVNQEPGYNDYPSDQFPIIIENRKSTKVYKGKNAPLEMHTPGIQIQEISLSTGKHSLDVDQKQALSVFLLEGELQTGEQVARQNDFFLVKQQDQLEIEAIKDLRLFCITSPLEAPYQTYAQMHVS